MTINRPDQPKIFYFQKAVIPQTYKTGYTFLNSPTGNVLYAWEKKISTKDDDESWRKISIELPHKIELSNFWYLFYDEYLICIFEISGNEGLCTFYDMKTLNPLWDMRIPGNNIGEPIIIGEGLYITASGYIGKINPDLFHLDWCHANLDKNIYSQFLMPQRVNQIIMFEAIQQDSNIQSKKLFVDRITGNIVSRK